MTPQPVAATPVEKQGSYTSMSGQLSRQFSEVWRRTEQLGRSATDWAPTSDAVSKVGSRKRHFMVKGNIVPYNFGRCLCNENEEDSRDRV